VKSGVVPINIFSITIYPAREHDGKSIAIRICSAVIKFNYILIFYLRHYSSITFTQTHNRNDGKYLLIAISRSITSSNSSKTMGKSCKAALRSENGKREEADALHIQLNRQLKYPSCGFNSTSSGAFNKDSGGVSDSAGRIYRRFKCRSRPKCGKTLGVTEFLRMCKELTEPSSVNILPVVSSSCKYIKY